MIEFLTRNGLRMLIALCAVMAVVGLFFRADKGAEALPLLYPLLGAISVGLAVLLVRLLAPLLRRRAEGGDDAD